ncbi:class I SAM-dependent methyltransferase [Auraticoccus monumenti]|uniref:Methyltransferase domain-containing protein n=1 Tax=Auraticoccus monumenti TaxID=675864 RepID=A0A1G6TVC6_9ACTN|nr:class I SAM-dependent methyltransferase [Auraticoccus monumenti]SDD32416.1 Methyltransferase domain-containing protein [Auraticoccus monumenti]
MSFDVAADAYGRFMGRYSEPLAVPFAEHAGIGPGQRVLDVGCGPGALTGELVRRCGAEAVAAVDPSPPFVEAVRARCPGVDVHPGTAEQLPFEDHRFDATLAQLVVHFMPDPVAGLASMRRVTRPGGTVAACVWDLMGGTGPLATFSRAVHDVDPEAPGEKALPGGRRGHLEELYHQAGLRDVEAVTLTVTVDYQDLEEWWAPYTLGVGPAGDYVAGLDPERRDALRNRCAELLGPGPFQVEASAWSVRGRA